MGLPANAALFNLAVRLGNSSERFLNLTVTDNNRRLDRVLKEESNLVTFDWPTTSPAMTDTLAAATAYKALLADPTNTTLIGNYNTARADLEDAATIAEKNLANAKKTLLDKKRALTVARAAVPQIPTDISNAEAAVNTAQSTLDTRMGELNTVMDAMGGLDSQPLNQTVYEGLAADKTGLHALDKADLFNLLCIPPDVREGDTESAVYQTAMSYCKERRAMLIVDAPQTWSANKDTAATKARDGLADLGLSGEAARNAALYFPRVLEADPLRDGQIDAFVPCGIVAGIMARTDTARGVWKAPAGLDASMNGIQGVNVPLNDAENGMLNPLGINCLRTFPVNGRVIWGARTLRGADQLADEWKYIPVRRTALFIEESLYRGTQWVVFEPNDEPLWAQIRLNIGAFMHNLFRQGAFQGSTPRDAYFVKCDKETTTQNDINLGIVNIHVGFTPLKPAEFVVIKIQQMAGQIEV